ncbi:hypothetical protein JCM10207_004091 [Rhodosporidiobolus poonsookiae]
MSTPSKSAARSTPPAATPAQSAPASQPADEPASTPDDDQHDSPTPTGMGSKDAMPSGLSSSASTSSSGAAPAGLTSGDDASADTAPSSTSAPPLKGGIDSLHSLYQALPDASSASPQPDPADPAAAEVGYPHDHLPAGYEGVPPTFYGAGGPVNGWEAAALGMDMGEGPPLLPFAAGLVPVGPKRSGNCKFFNAQKGFGFILDSQADELGGDEVFVHYTAILAVQGGPRGFRSLLEGETVEYTIVQGPKGWQAQDVTGPNGVPCIGTSPGAANKPMYPTHTERKGSHDSRSGLGRRPSGMTAAYPSTPGRTRIDSGFSSSVSPSTARSSYSTPGSRSVHLPQQQNPAAPPYAPSYPGSPHNFQPVMLYPMSGGPALHHAASMQFEPPPGADGRPSQSAPPPGTAYYSAPPGAVPYPGAVPMGAPDPRFMPPPQGYPLPGVDPSSSPYSPVHGLPYPISSSASSSGTFPPYPISSQTSPASHFLQPYPAPPPGAMPQQFGGYPPPPQQQQPYPQGGFDPAAMAYPQYPISSAPNGAAFDPAQMQGYGGEAVGWAEQVDADRDAAESRAHEQAQAVKVETT